MSYNPYTEEEMRLALRQLVNGTFTLNAPAQDSDADLVIARSITELTALRAWKEKARPFLKEYLDDNYKYYNQVAKESRNQQLTELLKEGE